MNYKNNNFDNFPKEKLLWEGRSSQLVNLPNFIIYGLISIMIIIAFYFFGYSTDLSSKAFIIRGLIFLELSVMSLALKDYLSVMFRKYQLSTERIRTTTGILNRRIDETELYRINDSIVSKPIWLRVFNLSNIILYTSDITNNRELILGIKDAMKVKTWIRYYVEQQRMLRSISELDIKQHKTHPHEH